MGNLSLEGNPIADKEDYREKVFEIFPELEILDGIDQNGNMVDSEDDDGEYGEEEDDISENTRKRLLEQGFVPAGDDDDEDEEYDAEEDFDDEDQEGDLYGDEDEEDEDSEEPAA